MGTAAGVMRWSIGRRRTLDHNEVDGSPLLYGKPLLSRTLDIVRRTAAVYNALAGSSA